jgi:di/tricarboxylate transporter
LQSGDILMVEGDSNALQALLDKAKFELVGEKQRDGLELGSDDVSVVEAIVRPNSALVGNTVWTFQLRWRYGVNLLGVAREGARLQQRLKNVRFQAGDVLLLQGPSATLQETLSVLGCLPLAERGLRFGPRRLLLSLAIFASAIGALAAGLVVAPIALVGAAVLMVLFKLVSLREAYDSIDWPVIVMLGAMLPIGAAMQTTGAADWVAKGLLQISLQLSPVATLVLVLLGVMFLSDVVNNAAAAVLMAPVAVGVARGMGASADPFLMAVAVGASCAFLTPIGHQSNTLVLGPGGYKFADYFRVGLPLEVMIVTVSIPLILYFWPLGI